MTGGEAWRRRRPRAPNGYRDTWCGEVLGDRVDSEVRVAGWVNRRRDHGGLIFIDLRDRNGLVQLVFHPDSAGEAFELAHKLRAEDVLSVAGDVVRRAAETGQPGAADRRGRAQVDGGGVLADRDAALPDRGLRERGRRGRAAALPLPRPAPRADARGADAAPPGHRAMREFLDGEGFVDVETPLLTKLDARGRPRLPRPQPPAAGLLLRAAAVAAAVQAAADGGRLRALLPDRPLLPRRGDRGPTARPSSPSSTSRCPSSTART